MHLNETFGPKNKLTHNHVPVDTINKSPFLVHREKRKYYRYHLPPPLPRFQ